MRIISANDRPLLQAADALGPKSAALGKHCYNNSFAIPQNVA